jgi:hypothetical protein
MSNTHNSRRLSRVFILGGIVLGVLVQCHAQAENQTLPNVHAGIRDTEKKLEVGDVVFVRIPSAPFKKVASTTGSWTNHVGIVIDVSGDEVVIAESRFPFSGKTTWSRFVRRSESGRVAVSRLIIPIDPQQRIKLKHAAEERQGILYDTGFDLHSHRQFCSRFVREVMEEAVGVKLGQVEDFSTLLKRTPQTDLMFWRVWYFGSIPWKRETVTPASLLQDAKLHVVFDGSVI